MARRSRDTNGRASACWWRSACRWKPYSPNPRRKPRGQVLDHSRPTTDNTDTTDVLTFSIRVIRVIRGRNGDVLKRPALAVFAAQEAVRRLGVRYPAGGAIVNDARAGADGDITE